MKLAVVVFFAIIGILFFTLNVFFGIFGDLGRLGTDVVLDTIGNRSGNEEVSEIERINVDALIVKPESEIVTPGAFRGFVEQNAGQDIDSLLTSFGVLEWTNTFRKNNGLPVLSSSEILDSIAQSKLQDMFDKEYFAHVSPLGIGVGDLAEQFAYEFIAIGENLALGNYGSDKILVQAWMDSPGHRENILHSRYQEIGIAVGQGMFEGNSTWLAVQTFGLSLSVCPQPDSQIKSQIDGVELEINELENLLMKEKDELKNMRPKRGIAYNQRVSEYNMLVEQYNDLIEEVQELISKYNAEVETFNMCAQGL